MTAVFVDGRSFSVDYRLDQPSGWHVYTCRHLPGLLVASRSLDAARADIEPSIRALLQLDGRPSSDE